MPTNRSRPRKAELFRDNIRSLLKLRGWTQLDAHEQTKIPLRWIQRACQSGIARIIPNGKKKNAHYVRSLLVACGQSPDKPVVLWKADLEIRQPFEELKSEEEFQRVAKMLHELVAVRSRRDVQRIITSIEKVYGRITGGPAIPLNPTDSNVVLLHKCLGIPRSVMRERTKQIRRLIGEESAGFAKDRRIPKGIDKVLRQNHLMSDEEVAGKICQAIETNDPYFFMNMRQLGGDEINPDDPKTERERQEHDYRRAEEAAWQPTPEMIRMSKRWDEALRRTTESKKRSDSLEELIFEMKPRYFRGIAAGERRAEIRRMIDSGLSDEEIVFEITGQKSTRNVEPTSSSPSGETATQNEGRVPSVMPLSIEDIEGIVDHIKKDPVGKNVPRGLVRRKLAELGDCSGDEAARRIIEQLKKS